MRLSVPLALIVLLSGPSLAEGPLRLPPDDPPPSIGALLALDPLGHALAVTISDDGAQAAGAFEHPTKNKSSLVRITREDGIREIDVRGSIVALELDSSGRLLYAVANRPGKQEPAEAWLVTVDLETGKSARTVTLPTSASDVDRWIGGGALLIACRDEVRTVLLPQVRTGPLFWIPGENAAVASIAGGDFALVGQESGIVLVNLSDPQGREQLPVRERVATPAPVDRIAAAPDGSGAVARLNDGRTFMVRLDPLGLDPLEGASDVVLWPGRSPEPQADAQPAVVETAAQEPAAAPIDPPAAAVVAAAPREPPPEDEAPRLEPDPEPEVEPESSKGEPTAPVQDPAPTPRAVESASSADLGELQGLVTGAEAEQVVAVILLGPDNILREAKRVVPRPDGSWEALDLKPGRYRVVLDGGGKHVVITEPSFRTVEIVAGLRAEVEAIEALRSIDR